MKKIVLLSILIIGFFAGNTYSEFQAGIATRDVTPNPLLPISGGIGPSNPTTVQKGNLNVRALVLKDDNTIMAIVASDFLGFPAVLGDRVRKMIETIPPENIMIGASHTHSAPDCYAFPNEIGEISADLNYIDSVCMKMAEAIKEAVANLKPAYVKIATGEAKGQIAYNYYAEKLYDPRCHVMQFLNIDETPIATLVNYAVHPEVLGPKRGVLSPDLVGPLYDRIEANGGGVGIFMNNALGGMVTADNRRPGGGENGTWVECIRIGNLLADESLRIVKDAPIQKNPELFCGITTIEFPIESALMISIVKNSPLEYKLNENNQVSTNVAVANVGNAQILTIPGEALPNIGFYLKRKMQGEHNFLFGLTNDAFGYILTKVDYNSFERYDYITRTCLGEMTGEIYIEEALKFVNECPKPKFLTQDTQKSKGNE
jgi:hypothetical protein